MKKLEYKVVIIYLQSQLESEEDERLKNLGLSVRKDDELEKEERQVRYSFRPSRVIEYRETFVKFRDEEVKGTIVSYESEGIAYETPVLLVEYEQFEKDLEEYEQFDKKEFGPE